MDKKKIIRNMDQEDLAGFEEFIEGHSSDGSFLPKQPNKKELSFEYFTFLSNDADRLFKLKNLLSDKLPFALKFEQGNQLLERQKAEISEIKDKLFAINDAPGSSYRKSLSEIFDAFFSPPKT
jgi:hypothetical protein